MICRKLNKYIYPINLAQAMLLWENDNNNEIATRGHTVITPMPTWSVKVLEPEGYAAVCQGSKPSNWMKDSVYFTLATKVNNIPKAHL